MATKNLLDIILENTFTRESLEHRLKLAQEFLEFRFFTPPENQNLIYQLNDFINQKKENRDEFNALYTWSNEFFDHFNKENLYRLLKNLKKQAAGLPLIVIYLPFTPPVYELPRLCGWFREKLNSQFLVEVKFNRGLIGGCALVWKGVYYDFSLEFYLERHKEEVKKMIAERLKMAEETNNKLEYQNFKT